MCLARNFTRLKRTGNPSRHGQTAKCLSGVHGLSDDPQCDSSRRNGRLRRITCRFTDAPPESTVHPDSEKGQYVDFDVFAPYCGLALLRNHLAVYDFGAHFYLLIAAIMRRCVDQFIARSNFASCPSLPRQGPGSTVPFHHSFGGFVPWWDKGLKLE